MRKPFALVLIAIFLALVFLEIPDFLATDMLNLETVDYLMERIQGESNSINIVTAVYLQTRVFDTIFETLLLLVSIVGVFHFAKGKGSKKW